MEVDLDNKELPLRIADTSEALARMCGVSGNAVRSSAGHADRTGERRRFVLVKVEGV